jgi:hypothetical protein
VPNHREGLQPQPRPMGELAGSDRITVARIAGVSSRRAAQRLNGQCSGAEAAAELAAAARGRADLLAERAGVITGATQGELAMQADRGREQARLCILAGADPGALARGRLAGAGFSAAEV